LRQLRALSVPDIRLLRTFHSTLPDDDLAGLPVETSLDEALARRPAAVVVANPTALHLDVAIPAVRAGCRVLIEKPVSHTWDRIADLRSAARSSQVLTGFQFRHHPGLRRLRELLCAGTLGSPLHASVVWGEHLPSWHPWEDYRRSYAARADLGGGVVLTLCHPFDYLLWLFGEVASVSAVTAQRGDLDIEVEDTAGVLLRFVSGVVAGVHLDYLARPARHRLLVVATGGSAEWDALSGALTIFRPGAVPEQYHPPEGFDREELFREQMRHFLACVDGREEPLCTLEDGLAALRVALAVQQAAAEGRTLGL
jgi:predicted dehydrogenase